MLLEQGSGLLAVAIGMASFQFKSQRRMFQINLAGDLVWLGHYALLGAWPVLWALGISIFRTSFGVFLWPERKLPISLGAFVLICLSCIVFPPEKLVGYAVVLTGAIYSANILFQSSYRISRSLMFSGSAIWIIIGIGYGSLGEVLASLISCGSILVASFRHRRKETQNSVG